MKEGTPELLNALDPKLILRSYCEVMRGNGMWEASEELPRFLVDGRAKGRRATPPITRQQTGPFTTTSQLIAPNR